MLERRKSRRIKLTPLAWLIGEREVGEWIVQNLNLTGIKVIVESALQVGDVVKLKLTFPDSNETVLTVVKVVWKKKSEDLPDSSVMGVEFMAMDEEVATKLQALIVKNKAVSIQRPVRGTSYFANLTADVAGGTTASMVALPEAIAYGTIVFAPLGPEFVSLGVIAGLLSLCISNLVTATCGGVQILNSGPYSLTSLMLASSVTIIASMVPGSNIASVIGLLLLVVFFCGLFQIAFGLLRFGHLVKYIPYPVISGLFNGTAILICLGQILPMLGVYKGNSSLSDLADIQPLTFFVGLVTIFFISFGPKLTQKIPSPFLGIAAGTSLYYLLKSFGVNSGLGGTIGFIPLTIPTPKYCLEFVDILFFRGFYTILPDLIFLSFSIAVFASFQSLIASISADDLLRKNSDTNRELIGQGLGNIVSSFFGGIVSAGSRPRTTVNYLYGGRTNRSRLASGLFALIILMIISPLVAKLPKIVLAGTVMALAFKVFDSWSIRLLSLLSFKTKGARYVLVDLVIVILVTFTMVVFGVFKAVAAGLFISVSFFIVRMGKNVVRRQYNGKRVRSNIHRSLQEIDYLEKHGDKIMLLELEGSLFFGTSDKVAGIIYDLIETKIEYIIVDLSHVSDIDSTGANILTRISDRCREKNKAMFLSSVGSVKNHDALSAMLALSSEGANEENSCRCFDTIDDAFGLAEDRILDKPFGRDRYYKQLPLSQLDVLLDFSQEELDTLRQYLTREDYQAGEVVFEQGTSGDRVFFLVRGRAQLIIDLQNSEGRSKTATICPGTIFGEMAIIDHGLRSSNIVAETDMSCYFLSDSRLDQLSDEHPGLSHKLLLGFARELSKRIRIANRAATELKG